MIGQYTFGTEEGSVSPDGYSLDLYYASVIPDYAEKQSDLIFDYQNNVKLYPVFQQYLREYQPKLLAVWGEDDLKLKIAAGLCRKFTDDEAFLQKELTHALPRAAFMELTPEHMTGKLVNES